MAANSSAGALAGLRVLELGQLIAGPYCTRLLAEFGAEVVKLEPPNGGDALRGWRKLHQGTSLWWLAQARNKKSIAVDLRVAEGQAIARELAKQADIVVENFRPGTLERWGLGYDSLAAANPGLVMVRLSGFGQTGPYRDRTGFGAVGEAMGGLRYLTGYPDRPPVRVGVSIGDSIAALFGAFGAMVAIEQRHKSGRGQVVDVALYEAIFAMMESLIPEYDRFGFVRERSGSVVAGIAPTNTYTCKDGKHVVIAGNGDSIFKRLMTAVERPDLGADPQLASNAGRVERMAEIDAAIQAWCERYDIDQVLATMEQADVPSGKIYNVADMMDDAQFIARGMIERHMLSDGSSIRLPGIVPKLSATPGDTQWLGPSLGAHTDEVLQAIGFDAQRRDDLRARGVIR
jgi:formyl-CoA transferase